MVLCQPKLRYSYLTRVIGDGRSFMYVRQTQLLCPSSRQSVVWPLSTSLPSFSTVFLLSLYTVIIQNRLEVLIHPVLFNFFCLYTCCSFCLESPPAFILSLISSDVIRLSLRAAGSRMFPLASKGFSDTQSILLS